MLFVVDLYTKYFVVAVMEVVFINKLDSTIAILETVIKH